MTQEQPGWAFAEIVVLWLAIMATTFAFFNSSKIAGWLMVPYVMWVSFASALNFAIWRLNSL
ncbi:TspO/MBR family protein [Gimesia chilikensis]|uniref:TspO/MBR family protein n=1 Tax=Gimesia chilikensis TaxID=2605989 RepID=UPI00119DD2D8